MDRAGRRRITALLNAGSGTGQGPALAETVRGLLGRGDAAVEVREIARGASVDGAIAAAKAARPDVLVAGGGDGTVSAVAAALVDSDIVLGVHYLTDVGAAFLEGVAWLALCLIAMDRFRARSPAPRSAEDGAA